jgi:hypothetical protein
MQCTIDISDHTVDGSGYFTLGGWEWGEIFKSEAGSHLGSSAVGLAVIAYEVYVARMWWSMRVGADKC